MQDHTLRVHKLLIVIVDQVRMVFLGTTAEHPVAHGAAISRNIAFLSGSLRLDLAGLRSILQRLLFELTCTIDARTNAGICEI